MKFCPECGAKLEDGAKFCTECGTKLNIQAAAPAPVVPTEPVYQPPTPQPEPEPECVPTPAPEPEPEPTYIPAPEPEPTYIPVPEPVPAKPEPARGGTGPQYKIAPEKTGEKKTVNKKVFLFAGIGVLAVIVIVLALALLLGGTDQGTEADWCVYNAVSGTVDGQKFDVKDEWLELKSKGEAAICILGETYDAAWTLEGEAFSLEQGGDTYQGTLKDGVLQLQLGKAAYVFAKEGASVGPTTYKAISFTADGETMDADFLAMAGDCYLVFNGDGSGTMYLFGDIVPITYDDAQFAIGADVSTYVITNGKMECKMFDGSEMTLELTDEIPTADTEIEPAAEVLHGDDLEVTLDWLGKPAAELSLSAETVSTRYEVETVFNADAVTGTLWVEAGRVQDIHLYLNSIGYEELRDWMIERFGEPTEEGEEPYAAANGGAVSFAWFRHPSGTLCLRAGSENDFLEIIART